MMTVKGKRETAPVLRPTAACSAGPAVPGDGRSRERAGRVWVRGRRARGRERNDKEEGDELFIYIL